MASFPFYQVVFGSINVLLAYYFNLFMETDREKFFQEKAAENSFGLPKIEDFDFIIVGGGSSGSLAAKLLSEKYTVLLLERAGNPLPQVYMPSNCEFLITSNYTAYHYDSVKQENCWLDRDGIATIDQGMALGGGMTVMGMVYNRGNRHDFDNWARIIKDDSWSYDNLLQYFKANENFIGENNDHLGQDGLLPITKNIDLLNDEEIKWREAWDRAGDELGYGRYENSNCPQKPGFGSISRTIFNGERVTAYDYFVKPHENGPNLKVLRYSRGIKVDINENKEAIGVLYQRHGVNQYARAKKEVLLSSGTFNTPLILMNSGIGPEDQLKEAEIPVISNLPVGVDNFQDHPTAVLANFYPEKKNYENLTHETINDYIQNRKGPLSNSFEINSQAFIVTETAKKHGVPEDWSDIQLFFIHQNEELFPNGTNTFQIIVSLGVVQSYGSLKLNTTHPLEPLIWDPSYFKEERDIKALVDGMKVSSKIMETKGFEELKVRVDKTPIPGCEAFEYGTDEYFECFARRKTNSHWHAVGSCRMGSDDDPKAVVDTQLRVKGIKGLRVIDNSVQVAVTNANTNAPCLAIARKAADMILKDYQ